MSASTLAVGPVVPWITGEELQGLPSVKRATENAAQNAKQVAVSGDELEEMATEAAAAASEILYELSGRQFTGIGGPVTVRPVSRPTDIDSRSWGARLSPLGWFSSWGSCSAYGSYSPGVVSHFGCSKPPEVFLGAYPIREVTQVKIDGVVIPGPWNPNTGTGEWELRDYRWLVRVRPTQSFAPTERFGWPTCQVPDLPDSQPGTFSVTYTYGIEPPASGVRAAKKLAEILLLPQLGDTTRTPVRVTNVSRQGMSASITDVVDILKKGGLGIYEVDAFLLSVNPSKNQRQAVAWSPDIGRTRRQSTVGP